MELRFLRKTEGKMKRDQIRNVITTIQQRQMRWLEHIRKMVEKRLIKEVFDVREIGRQKRERIRRIWKERGALEVKGVE